MRGRESRIQPQRFFEQFARAFDGCKRPGGAVAHVVCGNVRFQIDCFLQALRGEMGIGTLSERRFQRGAPLRMIWAYANGCASAGDGGSDVAREQAKPRHEGQRVYVVRLYLELLRAQAEALQKIAASLRFQCVPDGYGV